MKRVIGNITFAVVLCLALYNFSAQAQEPPPVGGDGQLTILIDTHA